MTDIEKLAQKILKELLPGGYTRMDYENITRHLAAWAKERDEMERLHECEGGVKKWIWQFLSQVN